MKTHTLSIHSMIEGLHFFNESPGLILDTSVTSCTSARCHQSTALPRGLQMPLMSLYETDTFDECGYPSVPLSDKQEDLTFVTSDLMDR